MKKLILALCLFSTSVSAQLQCNSTYNPYSTTPCVASGPSVSYNPNVGGVSIDYIDYNVSKLPLCNSNSHSVSTQNKCMNVIKSSGEVLDKLDLNQPDVTRFTIPDNSAPRYDLLTNEFETKIAYNGSLFTVKFKCDLTNLNCRIIGAK